MIGLRSAWLAMAAAAMALAASYSVGQRAARAVPASLDAHERGRQIYNFRCYFCHGYSGDAKTLASTYLSPKPRDFTRSALDAPQIATAVRDGRSGTAMK